MAGVHRQLQNTPEKEQLRLLSPALISHLWTFLCAYAIKLANEVPLASARQRSDGKSTDLTQSPTLLSKLAGTRLGAALPPTLGGFSHERGFPVCHGLLCGNLGGATWGWLVTCITSTGKSSPLFVSSPSWEVYPRLALSDLRCRLGSKSKSARTLSNGLHQPSVNRWGQEGDKNGPTSTCPLSHLDVQCIS